MKFLNSICVNDFTKLTTKGMRHAILCNDKGQILTDGVCIRIAEDRYRTYWLTPVINYYMEMTDLDVHGEDKTGTEYFIQIDGEKSLEIWKMPLSRICMISALQPIVRLMWMERR